MAPICNMEASVFEDKHRKAVDATSNKSTTIIPTKVTIHMMLRFMFWSISLFSAAKLFFSTMIGVCVLHDVVWNRVFRSGSGYMWEVEDREAAVIVKRFISERNVLLRNKWATKKKDQQMTATACHGVESEQKQVQIRQKYFCAGSLNHWDIVWCFVKIRATTIYYQTWEERKDLSISSRLSLALLVPSGVKERKRRLFFFMLSLSSSFHAKSERVLIGNRLSSHSHLVQTGSIREGFLFVPRWWFGQDVWWIKKSSSWIDLIAEPAHEWHTDVVLVSEVFAPWVWCESYCTTCEMTKQTIP